MLTISHFCPAEWGILALEGAIWRGFDLAEILLPWGILLSVGVLELQFGSADPVASCVLTSNKTFRVGVRKVMNARTNLWAIAAAIFASYAIGQFMPLFY